MVRRMAALKKGEGGRSEGEVRERIDERGGSTTSHRERKHWRSGEEKRRRIVE